MTGTLALEYPKWSLFFVFNLIFFLTTFFGGVYRFFTNNYVLGRLSFCFGGGLCVIYQLPLVLFSNQIEVSLLTPWGYASFVNVGTLLLTLWGAATKKLDFSERALPTMGQPLREYLCIGFISVAIIMVYMLSISWECTGLFALLFDPQFVLLAREFGVKLVGTSVATYSLGAYANGFAPVLIFLSVWLARGWIGERKYFLAFLVLFFGVISVVALLISGTKGLLIPSFVMLAMVAFQGGAARHLRVLIVMLAILLILLSVVLFEVLKERQTTSGLRYDFAACSVQAGTCEKSLTLLDSMLAREDSLGLPNSYIAPIQSRLICLCNRGGGAGQCPESGRMRGGGAGGGAGGAGGGAGNLIERIQVYAESILTRMLVIPFQVSVWHFMYAETESVEGVKTLPFAHRLVGDSLNMPVLVYQKYGSIYAAGDKTSTSTAPTGFFFSYSAYLGWVGFFLSLVSVVGLDLLIVGVSRCIHSSLMPVLTGIVVIMCMNFMASDLITVLISHGGIAGILALSILAFFSKAKV